jgi:2-desacetyl-2-hydroxyethyl bacteriochlorophyllide A dehydrogenase
VKTIVCEEPYKFALKEAGPPRRNAGEALIRIRRVGICGTDLHAFRGNQPFFEYPRVLGHELAGEVAEVDENTYGLRAGDPVTIIPYLECGTCVACRQGKTNCCTQLKVLGVHIDGGMCEYLSVPLDHVIKTERLSLDQAAIVEPLSIGAHAVRRGDVKKDEFVLVIGAGPIGLGVMKFAKLAGARVIAMDIQEGRLQFCKKWASVDHTVLAARDPLREVERITEGELPTLVFDATGNARSMMEAFRYVAHGGRLVYVGLVKTDLSFHDPEFHKREITLLASRNATRDDFAHVMQWIEKNEVDADSFITHRSRYEEMIDEFNRWMQPESGVIKAMVEW